MLLVFGATLFLSAGLLFLVQPMVARMVLPLLGGTPAVWNTSMVFFQGLLLAGYAYAHAAPERLGVRRQVPLHLGLLLVPFLVLPIAVSRGFLPPAGSNPIPWLMGLLLLSVGLPFFVLSTTAPLLQRWLAGTSHRAARDPYFLYAASNVGSMLALVGYPLVVEPRLSLEEQSRLWAIGYAALVAFVAACGLWTVRKGGRGAAREGGEPGGDGQAPARPAEDAPPTALQRLRWTALAFVPSSLMLGVTTYLTTDIAAIPLFWVLPLALYLATFILAFSGALPGFRGEARVWLPVLVLWVVLSILVPFGFEPYLGIPLHLATFFLGALVCHDELAKSRPASRQLTGFYLWMSFGGVLGGLFNVLVAPLVFSSVVEYPLALALACFFLRRGKVDGGGRRLRAADLLLPLAAGAVTLCLPWVRRVADFESSLVAPAITYAAALLGCFLMLRRPSRFALALCCVVLAAAAFGERQRDLIHQERSFFGVLSVSEDARNGVRQLYHGTTLHGQQRLDPARRDEPLTYYHRSGPIGQVFDAFRGPRAKTRVALIGLGTGSLASYGEPGQRMTYYEIDPAVTRIARDPRWFTFLRDSKADVEVVLGDARLRLAEAPDAAYGLLVLDAFSSDAIPVHLVTREALQLYLSKLEPGGVMAFHISNRYVDLEPVLAGLARDLGLAARIEHDAGDAAVGRNASIWVVLARAEGDLGPLAEDPRWRPLVRRPGVESWTDDYSNLIAVLKWSGKGRGEGSAVREAGRPEAAPSPASSLARPARGG